VVLLSRPLPFHGLRQLPIDQYQHRCRGGSRSQGVLVPPGRIQTDKPRRRATPAVGTNVLVRKSGHPSRISRCLRSTSRLSMDRRDRCDPRYLHAPFIRERRARAGREQLWQQRGQLPRRGARGQRCAQPSHADCVPHVWRMLQLCRGDRMWMVWRISGSGSRMYLWQLPRSGVGHLHRLEVERQ